MEMAGSAIMGLGGLLFFIGWIWLIVVGFRQSGAIWGVLIFLFTWVAGLVFCIMYKTGWIQLITMIIGTLLAAVGAGAKVLGG